MKNAFSNGRGLSGLMPYLSFFLFPLLFLSLGCNKTKDFEDLNLLVQKEWKLTSITKENVEISEPCDLDDILIFNDATTFNYDFGALLCPDDQGIGKTATGWKIIDDFTTLRIKFKLEGNPISGEAIEYWKILELNDTTLKIEDALAENNNQIPEVRVYLK